MEMLLCMLLGALIVIVWAFFLKTPTLTEEQLDDWAADVDDIDKQERPIVPLNTHSSIPVVGQMLSTSGEKGGHHSTDSKGSKLTLDQLRAHLKVLQQHFQKILSTSQSLDKAPKVTAAEANLDLVTELLKYIEATPQ